MLENMSKFILIIADFIRNNCLLTSMKQLPLELFKSVAFFLGHPVCLRSIKKLLEVKSIDIIVNISLNLCSRAILTNHLCS